MSQGHPTYQLEKPIWTDADFDKMGWHDARIWAMFAAPETFEFLLDLDYIFNWVHPGPGETYFKFWVAPVTMVFENAHDISISINSRDGSLEIADLFRENPRPSANGSLTLRTYRFECQEGEISLAASNFQMFVRRTPCLLPHQTLELDERGSVAFDRFLRAEP